MSSLYEFHYWRVGWIVRRLEAINWIMHERTCGLCRAARFEGGIEGFIEIDGELYNAHYEPLFARQDGRSFDLDQKLRDRVAWFETDEDVYDRVSEDRCTLRRPPRRWSQHGRKQAKGNNNRR